MYVSRVSEEVTTALRPEGPEEASCADIWGRVVQAEEIVGTKTGMAGMWKAQQGG